MLWAPTQDDRSHRPWAAQVPTRASVPDKGTLAYARGQPHRRGVGRCRRRRRHRRRRRRHPAGSARATATGQPTRFTGGLHPGAHAPPVVACTLELLKLQHALALTLLPTFDLWLHSGCSVSRGTGGGLADAGSSDPRLSKVGCSFQGDSRGRAVPECCPTLYPPCSRITLEYFGMLARCRARDLRRAVRGGRWTVERESV